MPTETTFLTADTTFVTGMASALSLDGGFYKFNTSRTRAAADAKAINNDWRMIGQDLMNALNQAFRKTKLPTEA